jgi:diguanylate cyclase (GGDEF)-like protein/PAS domain S-box-containing protein
MQDAHPVPVAGTVHDARASPRHGVMSLEPVQQSPPVTSVTRRWLAYGLLAVLGLCALAVALARTDALAGWNRAALAIGSLAALAAAVGAGWRGARMLRRLRQDIAELDGMRRQLRQAQDQYRFLFEHHPLPMWVFDRETLGFLAINDAMLASYGYTRGELLASTMVDIRPAEDAEAMVAAARLNSSERPQGRVWTHLRKDRSRLRAAIYTLDIDFNGRPARLVLAQDVTERELTEQRFQLVASATSDAIWDWDLATNALWWSDSFYQVFGYAGNEVAPTLEAWEALVHPDDVGRVVRGLEAAIASSATEWDDHYRFRHRNGSYVEVIDRGFILRDHAGRAMRAAGGMLDVSRQHRDQADLRLLRRAVEATDNGIVIADASAPDMPVVYVNPAFEQMTGYTAAEMLGRNCRILQGQDRAQAGVLAIREAMRGQHEVRTILRNYRKDGVMFCNEFRLAPVRDDAGALTHYVGVLTDVTERQHAEEQLAHRATHDELTGLPNRRLLLDRLQQAILHAARYGREVAVVFIDLDDFKLINDSFGHTAGDVALRVVAQRLQGLVRDTDTVGRFGGDEFVIVLTEQTDDAGVIRVIRRITEELAVPIEVAGITHTLTPSIGHCRYPKDGRDAESMLMRADLAMYQAKRQGRNRAVAYRAQFDETVSQRLQLVAQLREALERKEFVLAFQPIFDRGGQPVALEALVRWQHPQRGLLAPAYFIPVCEESGLIVELGRRVLHEAARHHPLLAAAGWGHLRIAVNVSAAQFGHDLFAHVADAVGEFALPRGVLELELTESVIMDNPDLAIDTMHQLASSGVCLSVDDFGTGYSSLAYLKRLPIKRLKIDRTFVQDLATDADDAAICAAIISMAHSLGLQTVAEGVETVEQMRWLHARGCDELQGFLLGRPVDFDEVLRVLARGGAPIPA